MANRCFAFFIEITPLFSNVILVDKTFYRPSKINNIVYKTQSQAIMKEYTDLKSRYIYKIIFYIGVVF